MTESVYAIEIAKLSLETGDTIAVITDSILNDYQRARLIETVNSALPEGVNVLVFDGGMRLQVIQNMNANQTYLHECASGTA